MSHVETGTILHKECGWKYHSGDIYNCQLLSTTGSSHGPWMEQKIGTFQTPSKLCQLNPKGCWIDTL